MRNGILFLLMLTGVFQVTPSYSQDRWNLQRLVDYAMLNNISVKQADVQARLSEITLIQGRRSLYPTLSMSGDVGFSSGRNQDPTSFGLITQSYLSSGFSVSAGANLFNWFSRRNTVSGYDLQAKAALVNVDRLKNDLALNVSAAYLQILLTQEQVNISKVQIEQTTAQLQNTLKLVSAGSVPELNASELEAQLATDSTTYITSVADYKTTLLQLKALMNMDAGYDIRLDTPSIEKIPIENIADLQPEYVYSLALKNFPLQRVNALNLLAAHKFVDAAKGSRYPNFSTFGSLGTAYNSKGQKLLGYDGFSLGNPLGVLKSNGLDTVISFPYPNAVYGKTRYFNQLSDNFSQQIGISVSIPILNGGTLRANLSRSKLDVRSAELQQELDNQNLKQDIYKAYNDATTSLQKFMAGKKTVAAAQKAYDFATKRYTIGLLNSIDLITNQNRLFTAKLNLVSAQFDYVFKMKVLEFYKGMGLKL